MTSVTLVRLRGSCDRCRSDTRIWPVRRGTGGNDKAWLCTGCINHLRSLGNLVHYRDPRQPSALAVATEAKASPWWIYDR